MIKIAIVTVKGTSIDYGQQAISAGLLLILEPLSQRRDGSTYMLQVERGAL